MLADIAHGNATAADISFLIGFILLVIAALLLHPRQGATYPVSGWTVMCLGAAGIALGLLLL